MLSFLNTKLPVDVEDRQWVDDGFNRLESLLGRERMLQAKVILPIAEDFPDPYDKTFAAAEKLFWRVCTYMQVGRSVDLEFFPDDAEGLREVLPYWRDDTKRSAAGVYFHDQKQPETDSQDKRLLVAIKSTQLEDPLSLVATIAHELGHVILLGGGLMDPKTQDHEAMTDLLTVFLGLGVFSANSAVLFKQYQDERHQGWSIKRQGYLPEQIYGYALAKFAAERGEERPEWVKYLSTNVRAYFRQSRGWLAKNRPDYCESGFRT